MSSTDDTKSFVPLNIAVLTISDTRSLADDKSGTTLADRLFTDLKSGPLIGPTDYEERRLRRPGFLVRCHDDSTWKEPVRAPGGSVFRAPARRIIATIITTAANGGPPVDYAKQPTMPSGGGGLVSTAGDYAAFAEMLRGNGTYRGTRIVSRRSVELMTTDQLTPAQKAGYELFPGAFGDTGWGFGVAVTTRRTGIAKSAGTYGWDGGLGTSWLNDPAEDLIAIVLTQQMMTSARPPVLWQDFWTTTYQALDG